MSTPHAILISLLEQPSSGYDLARRFDRSMGYFWRATHQQIYRELGRMLQQGWVAVVGETAGEAAASRKKVYQVLPAGRAEVARWVRETVTDVDGRNIFLIKLRAEAAIGPLGLDAELARLIGLHRERLQTYLDIEQRDFTPADALTRAQRVQYAILKGGIVSERAWLAWAEEVGPLLHA
ncbi:PadR family transcriptional regulator [Imbroritus primus]|uniref:PadR family transcriptional regulator n=1 Tax=Imbroritus primus TaxID=3058603 RepID=A0ACD3SU39_9BURK|nr:PadR family transcriptional regulator [Burkholderiaceae bacterium PBA]